MIDATEIDEATQPIRTIPWADHPLVPAGWPGTIPPAAHTITRWARREQQRIRRRRWLRRVAWPVGVLAVGTVGYVLVASLVSTLLASAFLFGAALIGGVS